MHKVTIVQEVQSLRMKGADRAHHWPGERGLAKMALETRMDRNWRLVMTAANSRAPNFLMVFRMNSWPAQTRVLPITRQFQ